MSLIESLLGRCDQAFVSETGLVRDENQDAIFVQASCGLYCVADGLGGGACGGLASRIVCEEVERHSVGGGELGSRVELADTALKCANARIRDIIRNRGYATMGATVAVMLFDCARPHQVAIGHVGDSRVYCRRNAKISVLTRDHRKSEYSHILTRAVGSTDALEVEWQTEIVQRGDIWLVCTDGVHDMLPSATINGILARGGKARDLAVHLSEAVRRAGARDNFSFCLVRT